MIPASIGQAVCLTAHFPLQRTHQYTRHLYKLIPLKNRGINYCNRLIVKCVRCSAKNGGGKNDSAKNGSGKDNRQSVMRTRPPKGGRAAKAASGVTMPA